MITKLFFPHPSKDKRKCILFVIETNISLTNEAIQILVWILNPNHETDHFGRSVSHVTKTSEKFFFIGPNLRFETPESEKARAICSSFGMDQILRIERFEGTTNSHISFDRMREAIYEEIPETLLHSFLPEPTEIIDFIGGGVKEFERFNKANGLGMDSFDIQYYLTLFVDVYKRNPTSVELFKIAQLNSSHCRHWEWSGKMIIDGVTMEDTLFQKVKRTLEKNPKGSIKAFNDNAGIIEGGYVTMFYPDASGLYRYKRLKMDHTVTAETHSHPSLYSPFPGAATGVGGLQRDQMANKRGTLIGFLSVYYQTGKLWLDQKPRLAYPKNMATPRELLGGVIKGSFSYGNPFGQPTLLFGNDSLGIELKDGTRFESIKPIVYVGGIGSSLSMTKDKVHAKEGMLIVRIGGATWRVGVGGGAASSIDAGQNALELDFKSVQRGEPMTERSVYNVVEHCVFLGDENPIEAITDQGAGGAATMLTELSNPSGAEIKMRRMRIGDSSLSQTEIWISESQEICGLLIKPENIDGFTAICKRYECPIEIVGKITGTQRIVVQDEKDNSTPVDLTLPEILGELPQKTYTDSSVKIALTPFVMPKDSIKEIFSKIMALPGVSLPTYMTDHFDGSVGGRVVQGPRDGAYLLPVCNYAIQSLGFKGREGGVGVVTRSNPVAMLIDEEATSRMTVATHLLTFAFVHIPGGAQRIKDRLNVMWPFKIAGMKARLYKAYSAMTDGMIKTGLAANGGKDSLSMSTSFEGITVQSFPTFIVKGVAHVSNFRNRVTPTVKKQGTNIILIELNDKKPKIGATALTEAYGETGMEVPDVDLQKVNQVFKIIQRLVKGGVILSGVVRQKGGLLTTLAKMIISGDIGISLNGKSEKSETSLKEFLFNEEAGIVIECEKKNTKHVLSVFASLYARVIGKTTSAKVLLVSKENQWTIDELRKEFLMTGKIIKEKLLGMPKEIVQREIVAKPLCKLTYNPDAVIRFKRRKDKIFKVAVLSTPGTNGQHELAHLFASLKGKFEVRHVPMARLISGEIDLNNFSITASAGGFSYGDVMGSGKGWAASILFNQILDQMFELFIKRPDTMSLDVCNGFQVKSLLKVFNYDLKQQPRLITNSSGIFEHRLVNLRIPENTRAIMFSGMGGSILPAWSAHAEGSLFLPKNNHQMLVKAGLVSAQYADETGKPTEAYPQNPSGSGAGIAGLSTLDGRHTAMMPHIERLSASNDHIPYRSKHFGFLKPIWQYSIENMYEWLRKNS
jgi:phosphoribosylformylglycinamidine synthase